MESSILNSTKKILGLDSSFTAFDPDIITFINSAFSTLNQLGVGPVDGFFIEDDKAVWDEFVVPPNQLHMVKTYIYLRSRFMFDPPTPGYLTEAMQKQIQEHEWRLNVLREYADYPQDPVLPIARGRRIA